MTKITEHNLRYYSMLGTLIAGFASVCMMLGRRDESFNRAQGDIVELRQITTELAKMAASTAQTTVHHGERIAELRERIERIEDRQ